MLFIDPDEVKVIPAGRTRCGCERYASWEMKDRNGEAVPFCGWCLMYGESEWGYLNRGELSHVGGYVRAQALRSRRKGTLVPELDEMHRLDPDAADRFVMGVVFTSRLLSQGPLGRLAEVAAEAEDAYGDGKTG